MLKNFLNSGSPFPADKLYIPDGAWLGTIALIILFMIFNTAAWSYVGLALIYILLGLHVISHHKALYGKDDILAQWGIALGAWLGSFLLVVVMPIYATINYATLARDIKQEYSDREYKIAWKIYMRMLGLSTFAMIIFLIQAVSSAAENGVFQ